MTNPTPYEILHGTVPRLNGLEKFGDIVAFTSGYGGTGTDLTGSRCVGIVLNSTGIVGECHKFVYSLYHDRPHKGSDFTILTNGNELDVITKINQKARREREESANAGESKPLIAWRKKLNKTLSSSAFIARSFPNLTQHHGYGYVSLSQIKAGCDEQKLQAIELSQKAEFDQLHNLETWVVMPPTCMAPAIPCHATYKWKTDTVCKTRLVAGGNRQDADFYAQRDNAAHVSTNASTKMTLTIAAAQNRSIRVLDVPGAYLHSKLDTIVYMELRGDLADFAVKHYPER
jgi:hypothetical protein